MRTGDPSRLVFARSTLKPLQAAVCLELADEALTPDELAVMAASHSGEPVHLEAVRALLARSGLGEDALRCPPALPIDAEAAREAGAPAPLLHNCSGKHAGMLLACVHRGYDPGSYPDPDHPLQAAVLQAVTTAAGGPPERVGVDGCGVPVHRYPLATLASIFARLGRPERLGGLEAPVRRVVEAMVARPYLVAGRGRLCTDVMEAAPGLVVKVGAEGVACAALPDRGLGVALKIEDGAIRARNAAAIRALGALEAVDATSPRLAGHARPPVFGGGRPVGELVADFELQPA